MVSLRTASSIMKLRRIGSLIATSTWNPMAFVAISSRHYQASTQQEASSAYDKVAGATKQGADAAKMTGENMKNTAATATEHVTQKTKDIAGKVSETTQDMKEKANQTIEEGWNSVKETAEKAKETVLGKA